MITKEAIKLIMFMEFAQEVDTNGDMYRFEVCFDLYPKDVNNRHESKSFYSITESLEWFKENYKNVRSLNDMYFSMSEAYDYDSVFYRGYYMTRSQNRLYQTIKGRKLPENKLSKFAKNFVFFPPKT